MHKKCFLTFLFFCIVAVSPLKSAAQDCYRLVFWNVENLFDTWDDSTRNDDDFTPAGKNRWSQKRYKTKLNHLYQTIAALGDDSSGHLNMPLVVGLAEVENDKVLRDLTKGTSLRRFNYGYIHFDSPDARGIDNALLYRRSLYTPFYSQAINVCSERRSTRDILLVEGADINGDTLIFLVNHFPSKRGGETADKHRASIAGRLRHIMDTLSAAHKAAAIIVMGDFNASPDDTQIMGKIAKDDDNSFVNLMANAKPGEGSYNYQGHWSFIDQIIVSKNITTVNPNSPFLLKTRQGQSFRAKFLLIDDDKNLSKKVYRTYLGIKYQEGYSDHLPVYIDLYRNKKSLTGRD